MIINYTFLCSLVGGFLSETGWDLAAEKIYESCISLCDIRNTNDCRIALKCLTRYMLQ